MSELTSNEIDHLAQLARINLSREEKERFSRELPKIADFVEKLQDAKVGDRVNFYFADLSELRDDVPENNNLSLEELKKLSPEFTNDYNVVPPVFGEQADA